MTTYDNNMLPGFSSWSIESTATAPDDQTLVVLESSTEKPSATWQENVTGFDTNLHAKLTCTLATGVFGFIVFSIDADGNEASTNVIVSESTNIEVLLHTQQAVTFGVKLMGYTDGGVIQNVGLQLEESAISGVDIEYAIFSSSTVAPTENWSTDAPTWQTGYYIWQRTATKYANGNTVYSAPQCLQNMSSLVMLSIEEQYYLSTSSSETKGGEWSSTQPTWESGKYLFTRSKITWSDNTETYSPESGTLAKLINDVNETAYATAISAVGSVDVEYAKSTSSTTAPTSGWTTTSPSWSIGYYIWQRTVIVPLEGTAQYTTPVCLQNLDPDNLTGITEQYYLSTSETTCTGGTWSYTSPTWEKDKYIWTRSEYSWANTTEKTYSTPVVATLYNQANKAVSDLDYELDQEGVFNRLTNNGTSQGIYIDTTSTTKDLYMNASYIKTGAIVVMNGTTTVFRADAETGQLIATKGTIGGLTLSSKSLYYGKSSLQSNTSGVYIGTDGISTGSGSFYMMLKNGYLQGGRTSSSLTGYVGFNNYWTDTGVYGARLAGVGCLALLTNGEFGIGSYVAPTAYASISTGRSGTISKVVTNLSITVPSDSGVTASWTTKNITFKQGLMITELS